MQQYLPTSMTDIVLLVILGLSAVFAMYRGFIREVLAIFSWIGAFFITVYFFNMTDAIMRELIPNEMIAHGLTAILLFISSLIVFSLLAGTIADFIHKSPLGSVDRLLGLGFGALRGALVICLVYFGISWAYAGKEMPTWVTNSKSLPMVQKGADYLTTLVPEEQRMKLVKMVQDVVAEKDEGEPGEPTLGKPTETGPIIKKITEAPTQPKDTEMQLPSEEVHEGKRALDDPIHVDKAKKEQALKKPVKITN
jgi:membrane protein required for colicin V production